MAVEGYQVFTHCMDTNTKGDPTMEKEKLKTCAVINDLSGFGRCALNVTIPVMSAIGVRVLSVPTAVLSNHTGFSEYYFSDLTGGMREYFDAWEKLGLSYDGIYSGFLGSEEQADIISGFIEKNRKENTYLFVDPAMGDDGKLYPTCTDGLVRKMRGLCATADIITPNLTEACFLAECDYGEMKSASLEKISDLALHLTQCGAARVIITGVYRGDKVLNVVCDSVRGEIFTTSSKCVAGQFCGTGDLFASILFGESLKGKTLRTAVKKASDTVARAAKFSEALGVSKVDGIAFEPFLKRL